MDKYKVAIVDDDEVALENLSFELGKDARLNRMIFYIFLIIKSNTFYYL